MREMADALWEGHTLLKTGLSAHRHTHTDRQTDRQTKVNAVCLLRRHISTSGFAFTAMETAVFALFLPVQPSDRYYE